MELIDNPHELQRVRTRVLWRLTQPVCQAAVDRLHLVIEPVLVALRIATEVRIPLERVLKGCPVDSDLGRAVTRRVYGDRTVYGDRVVRS